MAQEPILRDILVNCEARETRIAVIENGKLVELMLEREERVVGSIYKCRVVNVLPGMDAAFVDIGLERNAFLYVGDIYVEDDEGHMPRRRTDDRPKIKDLLKVGQEMLVQVIKGPRGTKGARVSTRTSIPGRYTVLMPEADHVGVSRKIEDAIERERLRRIAEAARPAGFGIIIRTEAEGVTEADLKQDVSFVLELWDQIQERRDVVRAPGVVYQDLSLLYRTLRDVLGADVRSIVIDSPEEYKKALEFVEKISPSFKNRVLLYDDIEPILMKHGVESEAERLVRRKVWLKGGGYLTIDETEALTSIDVNTGKFTGSSSLSETIFQVNLDAAEEAARQLRLRDIGGIVIVDFIDMTSERDRETLLKHFESCLALDRMRVKMSHISPLGLVELTRKRTAESINEVINQACPYCHGRGKIASTETVSIQIERELKQLAAHSDAEAFLVAANLEVALFLVGPEGCNVARLEAECGRKIFVRGDERNHVEEYGIIPGSYEELSLQLNRFDPESLVECLVDADSLIEPPRSSGWADGLCVELLNGAQYAGQRVHAKLNSVDRSYATGEVVGVGPPP